MLQQSQKFVRGGALLLGICLWMAATSTSVTSVNASGPTPTPTCDAAATCKFTPLPDPKRGTYNKTAVEKIDLASYPLVPVVSSYVIAIYQEGQRNGNLLTVFSKLSDFMP